MKSFFKDLYIVIIERGGLFGFIAISCWFAQFCSPFGSDSYFASIICFAWSIVLAYLAPMKDDIEKIKEKIDKNK